MRKRQRMKLSQTKKIDPQELKELQEAHKKQSDEVLKAYLKAKMVLEERGLPVVPAVAKPGPKPRRKIDMTLAAFALNHGLLDNLSGKEINVYRTLLKGLPFQYRMRDVLAEEAGVSVSTVRHAMIKLEAIGLIAKHRIPNRSCVLAFTDTRELSALQIEQMKEKYTSQLIEKVNKRPVIRKQQKPLELASVGSRKSSKEEKEPAASPRLSFFSRGLSANDDPLHQSQSGSGELNKHGDLHDQQGASALGHGDQTPSPVQPVMCTPHHAEPMFTPQGQKRPFASYGQHDMFTPDHADPTCTSTVQPGMFTSSDNAEPTFTSTASSAPTEGESGVNFKVKGADSNLSLGNIFRTDDGGRFHHVPIELQLQDQVCQRYEVVCLLNAIQKQFDSGVSAMAICQGLSKGPRSLMTLCELVHGEFDVIRAQEIERVLKKHMGSFVMRPVLAQLAVLRGDHPGQIETWIEYAKLKATNPENYGGLLGDIMIQAQRINTALLYPEAAEGLALFMDALGIGVTDDYVAAEDFGSPEEYMKQKQAGRATRKAILLDYCGVVHALIEQSRELGVDMEVDQVAEMIKSSYEGGDINGSRVSDKARGPVKAAMLKLALNRDADYLKIPQKASVYLPHRIHETRRQAKKELEAAQKAA